MTQEKKILLQIVTPCKVVLSKQVDEVRMPGMKVPDEESQLGVLLRHTPLLTSLHAGELIYRIGKKEKHLCVGWGFAEILNDKVTVLVDSAEIAHEIDITRAKKAKERAEEKLREYKLRAEKLRKEKKRKDKPIEDKPIEEESIEDKPIEEESIEEKSIEEEAVEEEPIEEEAIEEESREEKARKDKARKDKARKDKARKDKARKEKARKEKKSKEKKSKVKKRKDFTAEQEYIDANSALKKAVARINVANKSKGSK